MKQNIVLIGLTGSGKSTIGKKLAKRFSFDFIDMDTFIEKKEQKSVREMFETNGEDYFRRAETAAAKELSEMRGKLIATGGGVILNPENMEYLQKSGLIVFLDRTPEVILKKINVKKRPMLTKNPNRLFELYRERLPLYQRYAEVTVQGNDHFYQTLSRVAKALSPHVKNMQTKN